MGVIPNPKMAFIYPISCILALIFPILMTYFPKCEGKGSFLKFKIKSLLNSVLKLGGDLEEIVSLNWLTSLYLQLREKL